MSIFSMSLSASLTILAVVILRWLFIHKLPKKTFMLLWAIVICQLLIPVSIPSRFSIWNLVDALASMSSRLNYAPAVLSEAAIDTNTYIALEIVAAQAVTNNSSFFTYSSYVPSITSGTSLLFWLWLTGFVICILFFLLPHMRCRRMYKTALPVENGFVRRWLGSHPQRYSLHIKQSDNIDTPLTFGILWPVILLPRATDWQDETRLFHILNHEYEHIRRSDIIWKWVLAFSLGLHWFNPLAWLMYILANRDIELSCDEAVVRYYGENSKSEYAMTLLGLEEKRSPWMSLCNNFSKNAVEERIVSIMKFKKPSFITLLAAFILIFGTSLVFATSRVEIQSPVGILPLEDINWVYTPDFVVRNVDEAHLSVKLHNPGLFNPHNYLFLL